MCPGFTHTGKKHDEICGHHPFFTTRRIRPQTGAFSRLLGKAFLKKTMFERKVPFFLRVLPILFDTARERASKSAMEGFVPAKKLGLLSTREVRAFVTCGGWLQIWECANFQFYVGST